MDLSSLFIGKTYAAESLGNIGGTGLGLFGSIFSKLTGNASTDKAFLGGQLNGALSILIGFLTTLAAIWFIIKFIIGAFQWLNSGGDQKQVQNAQQTMTNAVIGLAIIVAAYAIISVLASFFGIDILHPNLLLFPTGATPTSAPTTGGGNGSF
jgi:hypothetical protein